MKLLLLLLSTLLVTSCSIFEPSRQTPKKSSPKNSNSSIVEIVNSKTNKRFNGYLISHNIVLTSAENFLIAKAKINSETDRPDKFIKIILRQGEDKFYRKAIRTLFLSSEPKETALIFLGEQVSNKLIQPMALSGRNIASNPKIKKLISSKSKKEIIEHINSNYFVCGIPDRKSLTDWTLTMGVCKNLQKCDLNQGARYAEGFCPNHQKNIVCCVEKGP